MLPAMNHDDMVAAIGHCAAIRILASFDAGIAQGVLNTDKPKHKPMTTQDAIDNICARVKAKKAHDLTFSVAVTYSTHDAVKGGIVDLGTRYVTVLTDTDTDAQLVAAQMVACRGFMPTSTLVTDVIA